MRWSSDSDIIKLEARRAQVPHEPNWTVDNIVAYSTICTHVGCPAALYSRPRNHILCPCHQSRRTHQGRYRALRPGEHGRCRSCRWA